MPYHFPVTHRPPCATGVNNKIEIKNLFLRLNNAYANSYLKISDTAFADIVEAVSQEAAQTSTYFGVNIKPQRICDMLRSKAQEEAAHTRT
ncbi:hypothetical protein MNBD_GAMMA18-1773 [hydrothermal vent metagenome]|uniref:Uncharacterized protein n=1 Tax=hydrothermal vent metagenome TaxID=652676 RepID=A0A3B0ZA42_9ZZZZ